MRSKIDTVSVCNRWDVDGIGDNGIGDDGIGDDGIGDDGIGDDGIGDDIINGDDGEDIIVWDNCVNGDDGGSDKDTTVWGIVDGDGAGDNTIDDGDDGDDGTLGGVAVTGCSLGRTWSFRSPRALRALLILKKIK